MVIQYQIEKILATSTFYIKTLKPRTREFLQIRFLGRHKQHKILKTSVGPNSNRIAIVALFPRKYLLVSVMRLIDQLIKNGYQVLVVVNEGSQSYSEWIGELERRNISILSRPNIGRDFGAYQTGIRYVQSLPSYPTLERIVLANDSCYYFPKSTKFLDGLLKNLDPWFAMFVNFQFHLHAQSFFLSFDRSVFLSESFTNFWSAYYPTSFRHNVINKGEVRLSKNLMVAGFSPKSYITADKLESAVNTKNFTMEEKFALWEGIRFAEFDFGNQSHEFHVLQMRRTFTNLNPSHHLGMLSTRAMGAPLKLDLLRGGLVSLAGLADVAKLAGITDSELKDFKSEMSSKGSQASVFGLHKLWRNYGFE